MAKFIILFIGFNIFGQCSRQVPAITRHRSRPSFCPMAINGRRAKARTTN